MSGVLNGHVHWCSHIQHVRLSLQILGFGFAFAETIERECETFDVRCRFTNPYATS